MEHPLVDPKSRDWYSVSVDTLRAWGIVLTLAVMVAVGFLGYRYWERYDLERRASEAIGDARMLSSRLRSLELPEEFRDDHRKGTAYLAQATSLLVHGELEQALTRGRDSREIFASILDATGGTRGGVLLAQILSFVGRVEYRRSDGGEWESARQRAALYSGDHLKTGPNGSANVLFLDGTHYAVRPDTQVVLIRGRNASGAPLQKVQMDYGRVHLDTNERGGTVATPDAEARIEGDSKASVGYDAETRTGRFATFQGSMEVAAGNQARRVGALQELVQRDGRLSEAVPLPPAPDLEAPEDNLELEKGSDSQLVLAWRPVEGAESYSLQVSSSQLFVDNLIDIEGRRRTRATLGVRGEGLFHWRVAAAGPNAELGPWSDPRRFRVAPAAAPASSEQREPPPLVIDRIESYGSIFLVTGKTEPGIRLTINGEPVRVEADGEFSKTVQFTNAGWRFIEVRASDGAGAEATVTRRVFVEIL